MQNSLRLIQAVNLCQSVFFANWLAALSSLEIYHLCVKCRWQENLTGQASTGTLGDIFANLSANRKQAKIISLILKSVPYGKI